MDENRYMDLVSSDTPKSASTMAEHADVIFVRNLVHDGGLDAVAETVRAATEA